MITLPTTSDYSDYEQDTTLGDTVYRLRFTYNSRDDAWYLSVSNAAGDPLIVGQRIRTEQSALGQYVVDGLPDGVLLLVDVHGTRTEPGRDSLAEGKDALIFVGAEELA